MINDDYSNGNSLLLDFEALPVNAIALEADQIQQAAAISNNIINPQQQWQTYLEALGWLGFESWLQARDGEIAINSVNCSLTQASYANFISGVFNLEVNQFKVCILTPGVVVDEVVSIPRAVIELPEYVAHFYVIVAVDEEREEATVTSFISYEELKQLQQSANLQPDSDWNYELPMSWLDTEPDKLLLYLRCLETSTILLPTVPNRTINLTKIQTELESLIPQLQSETTALADVLTWEQAIPLLTNPTALDWLYNLKTNRITNSNLSTTLDSLTERVINVGAWLQNELDEIAQSLAWNLLPTPALATSAFRNFTVINQESPTAELASIIAQLRDSGSEIPSEASSAYRDFKLGKVDLRIFAIAWTITPVVETPEWSLLIVLGGQPNQQLPLGLQLILQDLTTTLDEKIVETPEDTYLYTLVIGNLEERFMLKLVLLTGETLIFPPFCFTYDSEQ